MPSVEWLSTIIVSKFSSPNLCNDSMQFEIWILQFQVTISIDKTLESGFFAEGPKIKHQSDQNSKRVAFSAFDRYAQETAGCPKPSHQVISTINTAKNLSLYYNKGQLVQIHCCGRYTLGTWTYLSTFSTQCVPDDVDYSGPSKNECAGRRGKSCDPFPQSGASGRPYRLLTI